MTDCVLRNAGNFITQLSGSVHCLLHFTYMTTKAHSTAVIMQQADPVETYPECYAYLAKP